MKYVNLGRTGLRVSRVCLGGMTFGPPKLYAWTLDEDASRPLIRQALEKGINFFDTSNSYSYGASEEILGRALKDFAHRDEIVVATKVYVPWRNAPNTSGLSRKSIMAAVDDSLRRLQVDYIDLYQIHRWDPSTPIEETLGALNDLVRAGKVRYIGASSMYAWQFHKALNVSEKNGLARFVSMQNCVNLLYREEEREMLPLCADQGIGVIPWGPLAAGRLTRDWDEKTHRSETDENGQRFYAASAEADRRVVEAVAAVAAGRKIPKAQVALAWLLAKKEITSPIIGAGKPNHIDDAVAAIDVKLTPEEIAALEAPYVPHAVAGLGGAPARFPGKTAVSVR